MTKTSKADKPTQIDKTPRIMMSAGGTGGGVYPALAVTRALQDLAPHATRQFVGSARGIENDLIARTDIQFHSHDRVQGGPIHGVNIFSKILSLIRLLIGTFQALFVVLRRRPHGVFLTGGWVSLPIALVASLFRIPIVIFVPDIEPGRTLKLLGRFAKTITATVQDTEKYYPTQSHIVATGYPLRKNILQATREQGIQAFGLDPKKQTLLVFGGSLGSRAINRAILSHIDNLLDRSDLQILHVSGKLDAEEVQSAHEKLPLELKTRYYVYDYIHEFGPAMAAADLVVSRAGASTLGEFTYFGLPAILIPLAYSWRYQEINADWLAQHGAAIRLDESNIDQLVPQIHELLDNKEKLDDMRHASHNLAIADGAERIAQVILATLKFSD